MGRAFGRLIRDLIRMMIGVDPKVERQQKVAIERHSRRSDAVRDARLKRIKAISTEFDTIISSFNERNLNESKHK